MKDDGPTSAKLATLRATSVLRRASPWCICRIAYFFSWHRISVSEVGAGSECEPSLGRECHFGRRSRRGVEQCQSLLQDVLTLSSEANLEDHYGDADDRRIYKVNTVQVSGLRQVRCYCGGKWVCLSKDLQRNGENAVMNLSIEHRGTRTIRCQVPCD